MGKPSGGWKRSEGGLSANWCKGGLVPDISNKSEGTATVRKRQPRQIIEKLQYFFVMKKRGTT